MSYEQLVVFAQVLRVIAIGCLIAAGAATVRYLGWKKPAMLMGFSCLLGVFTGVPVDKNLFASYVLCFFLTVAFVLWEWLKTLPLVIALRESYGFNLAIWLLVYPLTPCWYASPSSLRRILDRVKFGPTPRNERSNIVAQFGTHQSRVNYKERRLNFWCFICIGLFIPLCWEGRAARVLLLPIWQVTSEMVDVTVGPLERWEEKHRDHVATASYTLSGLVFVALACWVAIVNRQDLSGHPGEGIFWLLVLAGSMFVNGREKEKQFSQNT